MDSQLSWKFTLKGQLVITKTSKIIKIPLPTTTAVPIQSLEAPTSTPSCPIVPTFHHPEKEANTCIALQPAAVTATYQNNDDTGSVIDKPMEKTGARPRPQTQVNSSKNRGPKGQRWRTKQAINSKTQS